MPVYCKLASRLNLLLERCQRACGHRHLVVVSVEERSTLGKILRCQDPR